MEIERKFVLERRPPGLDEHPHQRIEQGYVAIDPDGTEVRVRRKDGGGMTMTVKSGAGLVRTEEELPLEPARFEALWPLTDGRRVVKTRYLVPIEQLTAEVDEYEEALEGLRTAEVEFESEAESAAFRPPGWLGREVTGDARYANRALAVSGLPE